MSQQGPILVVSTAERRPSFAAALDEAQLFPVIESEWSDAARAVEQMRPAAVIAATAGIDQASVGALAESIARHQPYLPLIAVDPDVRLPGTAIPFFQAQGMPARLIARLNAALRIRSLHATVMRRLVPPVPITLDDIDPSRDATVLLIGRGGAYPALSVAIGERAGLVGALSIEAAARHLNARDIDGIVLGEGFSARVMDAFLTVLTEDARFRSLPVVVASNELAPSYDLANLEVVAGDPAQVVATVLPLVRQHAFEAHLSRTLLTTAAFERDFATAVYQSMERGGGLSLARFAFDPEHPRARFDGARIISRLMRKMDFGAVLEDGSVIVVFAETDLKNAHAIARRLTSVMRHTSHGKRDARAEPDVSVAQLLPNDSAKSLLARLYQDSHRAAS